MKKQRCDLFNKAFNHISQVIDEIYKDLTKGKASPMGGVAYLSLEDTEVGSLLLGSCAALTDPRMAGAVSSRD